MIGKHRLPSGAARLAEESDAAFLFSLRSNNALNRYLNTGAQTIEDQRAWLREYKKRESLRKDFYFVFEDNAGAAKGCLRVYDIDESSFTWGSWIFEPGVLRLVLESAHFAYFVGFILLGVPTCRFDVRVGNLKVLQFHRRFGARELRSDSENVYFEISRQEYEAKHLPWICEPPQNS